mmetsp:Transcript_46267/g.119227  ORF Transcript_46267/g.119227 Transcript_46267/m.119227 type:complete len:140 (-) Transcript_46267:783-1202(-)
MDEKDERTFPISTLLPFHKLKYFEGQNRVTLAKDAIRVAFGVRESLTVANIDKITVEDISWFNVGWKWNPVNDKVTYAGTTSSGVACLHFKEKEWVQIVYGIKVPSCKLCISVENPHDFVAAVQKRFPAVQIEAKAKEE